MKAARRPALVSIIATLLIATGCTVLPESEPVTLHYLPVPAIATKAPAETTDWTLRVKKPDASDALAGRRLMVATPGHELNALAGARWASPVPALWQNHLIAALRADGRITAVSSDSDNLHAGRILGGVLQAFQLQIDDSGQAAVVIRYDATLADAGTRHIIASRSFESRRSVTDQDRQTIVRGFGEAAGELAATVTQWLVSR